MKMKEIYLMWLLIVSCFILAHSSIFTDTGEINSSISIDVKEIDTSTSIHVKEINTSTSIDVKEINTRTSIDMREIRTSTSIDVREIGTSTSIDMKEIRTSTSIDVKEISTSTSIDVKEISTSTSIDMREINTSTSIDMREISTSTSIDVKEISTSTSIDVNEISTSASIDVNEISTSASIDVKEINNPAVNSIDTKAMKNSAVSDIDARVISNMNDNDIFEKMCEWLDHCKNRCQKQPEASSYFFSQENNSLSAWINLKTKKQDRLTGSTRKYLSCTTNADDEWLPLCYCDESCVVYKDCCIDVFDKCFNLTNPEEIQNFITERQNRVSFDTYFRSVIDRLREDRDNIENIMDKFVSEFGACRKVNARVLTGVMLVALCPEKFPDAAMKLKCEHPNSPLLPPVTASIIGIHVHFSNVYCAQCHGIDMSLLTVWGSETNCKADVLLNNTTNFSINDLKHVINSDQCRMNFKAPPKTCKPRGCSYNGTQKAELKNELIKRVEEGSCPLREALACETTYFSSQFWEINLCSTCLSANWHGRNKQDKDCAMFFLSNFALHGGVLAFLDFTDTYSRKRSITTSCADDEVLDPFTQECKELVCPFGLKPQRGVCIESNDTFFIDRMSQPFPMGWDSLIISTTLSGSNSVHCNQREAITHNQWKDFFLKVRITNFLNSSQKLPPQNSRRFEDNQTLCEEIFENIWESGKFQQIDVTVKNVRSIINHNFMKEIDKIVQFMIGHGENQNFLITNMRDVNESNNLCKDKGHLQTHLDFSLMEYANHMFAVLNTTQNGVYYPFENIGYEKTTSFLSNGSVERNEKVFVCGRSQLFSKNMTCKVVFYHLDETVWNESCLLIIQAKKCYPQGEFEIIGQKVLVCSDFQFAIKIESVQVSMAYVILSWVLGLVSISFLFCIILVYCMVPELCTLPGKMTASLAGTMMLTFLGNLFTLVEFRNDYVCPVAAALSHLVTLAHFGWMAAIAVNMSLTFAPCVLKTAKSHESSKIFAKYNIVVWGLSSAIVTATMALHIIHSVEQSSLGKSTTILVDNRTSTSSDFSSSYPPSHHYPVFSIEASTQPVFSLGDTFSGIETPQPSMSASADPFSSTKTSPPPTLSHNSPVSRRGFPSEKTTTPSFFSPSNLALVYLQLHSYPTSRIETSTFAVSSPGYSPPRYPVSSRPTAASSIFFTGYPPTTYPLTIAESSTPPNYLSSNHNISPSSSAYPRYGDPFCTWFSGPLWTKLAFVYLPFCATYIISLTGFTTTLIGIHRSSRHLKNLGKRSADRTCCWIYIKLSTAMGFAWIGSILVNLYPQNLVLAYLYQFLVLLQGPLLFMAFMVNKRVYTLIMKKLRTRKENSSTIPSTLTQKTVAKSDSS